MAMEKVATGVVRGMSDICCKPLTIPACSSRRKTRGTLRGRSYLFSNAAASTHRNTTCHPWVRLRGSARASRPALERRLRTVTDWIRPAPMSSSPKRRWCWNRQALESCCLRGGRVRG